MKKGILAFDYDGVLADTFEPNIKLINRVFKTMNMDLTITRDHFNVAEEISFRAVVTAAGLPTDKFEEFIGHIIETGHTIIDDTFLFPGMKELLQIMSEEFYITAVSNNSTRIVRPGLEKEGADHFFDKITGSDNDETKEQRLEIMQKEWNVPVEKCWMIGDGINDIESAHEAGWRSIACTWGFQKRELLETRNPDFIAETLEELKQIVHENHV